MGILMSYAFHEYEWALIDQSAENLHAMAREIAEERGVDLETAGKRSDLSRLPAKPAKKVGEPKPFVRRYVRTSRLAPRKQRTPTRTPRKVAEEIEWKD